MININLKKIPEPIKDWSSETIYLSNDTLQERLSKVISSMEDNDLNKLVIYADVEHGGNFEYLVGFFPRFEEALLILDLSGEMSILLGNENLNKAEKSRNIAIGFHAPVFSLPNQCQGSNGSLKKILQDAGISSEGKVGIVGWKLFTGDQEDDQYFDIPHFIVDNIKKINSNIINSTSLFIGDNGVRTTNNANEIAFFEFGASLSSDNMLDALNSINLGKSEIDVANHLNQGGQHSNVVTISSSGDRYVMGNMFPTSKKIKLGEPMSLTVSHRGGLSSRSAYIAKNEDDLDDNHKNYLNELAIPYFNAYSCWLENIEIGLTGGKLYSEIEHIFPKSVYGWYLCPGHLTSYEEWSSSPIYEGSKELLKSGMILQVDIIPFMEGYSGVSCESTVVLADDNLKAKIRDEYPEMWKRMIERTKYIKNVLGIELSRDVLPMCSTVGYMRPYLLDKESALVKIR